MGRSTAIENDDNEEESVEDQRSANEENEDSEEDNEVDETEEPLTEAGPKSWFAFSIGGGEIGREIDLFSLFGAATYITILENEVHFRVNGNAGFLHIIINRIECPQFIVAGGNPICLMIDSADLNIKQLDLSKSAVLNFGWNSDEETILTINREAIPATLPRRIKTTPVAITPEMVPQLLFNPNVCFCSDTLKFSIPKVTLSMFKQISKTPKVTVCSRADQLSFQIPNLPINISPSKQTNDGDNRKYSGEFSGTLLSCISNFSASKDCNHITQSEDQLYFVINSSGFISVVVLNPIQEGDMINSQIQKIPHFPAYIHERLIKDDGKSILFTKLFDDYYDWLSENYSTDTFLMADSTNLNFFIDAVRTYLFNIPSPSRGRKPTELTGYAIIQE